MKRLEMFIVLLAVFLAADVHETAAQNSVGINAGYNIDAEEFFMGGQFRYAPAALPVVLNPSVETYFIDGMTWLQIDANALYLFGVNNTTFTPYAGAGLGIGYRKVGGGDGNTAAGLNLLFGAEWGMARIRPFTEARMHVDGDVGVGVRGGVLVGL